MMRTPVAVIVALIGLCLPAAAEWDFLTSGSGRYTGHSTGVINAAGTESLSFLCSMSMPGAIWFEFASLSPAIGADGSDIAVEVEVGGDRFEIDAVLSNGGDSHASMTWGRQAAVTGAARRIAGSAETITVIMGADRYQFPGPGAADTTFAQFFEACG